MLFSFKDVSHSWFIRIVFFIVLIVFSFFGVYTYLGTNSLGTFTLAEAGGNTIEVTDFQTAYQNFANSQTIPKNQETSAKRYVLESLINQQVMEAYARDLGMVISEQETFQAITSNQSFFTDGRFDRRKYDDYLTAAAKSSYDVEQEVVKAYRLQLLERFIQNLAVTNTDHAEALFKANSEERTIEVAHLNPQNFFKDVKVSDEDLRNFYNQNLASFKVAPSYDLELYRLKGTEPFFGAPITTDQKTLEAFYAANPQLFTDKPAYRVAQIMLLQKNNPQQSLELAAKISRDLQQDPGLFASYVKKYSDDPFSKNKTGELGWIEYGGFLAQFEEGIKGLKVGEISAPIHTPLGIHIVKLLEKRDVEKVRPFVEQQVKAAFLQDAYKKRIDAYIGKTLQASDFEKAAKDFSQPDKLLNFNDASGAAFPFGTQLYGVLKDGDKAYGSLVFNNELLLFHVLDKKPERTASFDEVKPKLEQTYLSQKAQEQMIKKINADANKLQTKANFDAFVKTYGLETEKLTVKRDFFGTADLPADFKSELFNLPEDQRFFTKNINNAVVAVYLLSKKAAASTNKEQVQTVENNIQSFFTNYTFSGFIEFLRKQYPASYNQAVMTQLGIALDTPQTAANP